MPCLCGDTACPSCGPAQGYNREEELFWDALYTRFPSFEDHYDKYQNLLEPVIEWILSQGEQVGRTNLQEEMYLRDMAEKLHPTSQDIMDLRTKRGE